MSRISKAYEFKFRKLLELARARRLDEGLQWVFRRARILSERESVELPLALARLYEQTRHRLALWQDRRTATQLDGVNTRLRSVPTRFLCDVGLGGLARWLRAAGYEALWNPHLADDDELLREARRTSAMLLTTDSLLMERRVLRDGEIPAFWVSPALTMLEQLTAVLLELRLSLGEPRCMNCGGELRMIEKEKARDRIPPKTYRWLDEYFVCKRCDKLFWHGTHWQKIEQRLQTLPSRS